MCTSIEITNKYLEEHTHWHSESQPYASGDQLNSMLMDNWKIDKVVFRTEHHIKLSRRLIVFYVVVLVKDDERINMPVLVNPFVERLVKEAGVNIINVERHHKKHEQKAPAVATQKLAIAN